MRQEMPAKAGESIPMVLSAAVTMVDTRAGVGVGSGPTARPPSAVLTSLGNSGGQTMQRFPRLPLQLVRGRVPATSANCSASIQEYHEYHEYERVSDCF
jgi:hypothetical protein